MRLRVVIILVLLLAALPRRAVAQGDPCTNFDFTQGYGGFAEIYGEWIAGEGWRSEFTGGTEVLQISSMSLLASVTSIDLTWQIVTWGGGGSTTTDLVWVGTCPACDEMISQAPVAAPGVYELSWSGSATRTGPLNLQLFASKYSGSDGLAYLRSLEVCGPVLPEEWSTGGFVISDPWPGPTPWARATPTPWPTPEATLPFGVVDSDLGNVADTAINMYHYANQQGALDTLFFFLMTGLILILIFRVIRKLKQEA